MNNQKISTRVMAGSAMLSALAVVLQFIEFPLPMLMPPFIKFDVSDLPPLIGAFAYGPLAGVLIELIKNLIHCAVTKSAAIGELSNFILGACFTATAGAVYRHHKTKRTAIIGAVCGSVVMGLVSVVSNYYIVYPFYYRAFMPEEVVLSAYQAILPGVTSILQCLFIFNLPFTIVKGVICTLIAIPVYKPLRKILKQ